MRKRTPSPENYFLIVFLFKVLLLLHPNYKIGLGYGGIGESELPSPEKLLFNLLFIISSLYITADTPKTKKSTAALRSPQAG
ncbi:MAG: hypothetical protein ACYS1A_00540 [Planctomycetota bacterium]|jgi:hypothetical protein